MRATTLKIDSNVPIPTVNINAITWKKMRVGDNVFFESNSAANKFAQSLYQATKDTKYRQLVRKVDGGWRVWKVKREHQA